jgi:hypothetical protein
MVTKLTLTIDHEVIEAAKIAARDCGRSLSDLVENYLRSFTALQSEKVVDTSGSLLVADQDLVYSSRLQSLQGIAKNDNGFDYKKQLAAIKKKRFDL